MCSHFAPKPRLYAQNDAAVPQIPELHAWLGLEFCFLLIHPDAFFCSHSLRIFITFVRYKIKSSATEGLVQQSLQEIWVFGLI